MPGAVGACYQNVVQVDENTVEVLADHVHEPLKGLGRVFKSEGHAQKFVESKMA